MRDWPDVVTPRDVAAHLRLGGERPDKAVRAWLREIHPEHGRYQRWEFTPREADALVTRWRRRALVTGEDIGADRLVELLGEAKRLAREYRELTGRPLGVTGEVAEYEAARLLEGVELSAARQSGYDAVRKTRSGQRQRLQIKGRCILPGSKPGQRVGRIDLTKKWDVALLVLLDEHFEATAIYEASRARVTTALTAPGSKARNERGQLGMSKFRSIGRKVWPPP